MSGSRLTTDPYKRVYTRHFIKQTRSGSKKTRANIKVGCGSGVGVGSGLAGEYFIRARCPAGFDFGAPSDNACRWD